MTLCPNGVESSELLDPAVWAQLEPLAKEAVLAPPLEQVALLLAVEVAEDFPRHLSPPEVSWAVFPKQ